MYRDRERGPILKTGTYLKYGFVITEKENYLCPAYGHVLSAGPDYQPRYCDQCEQRVTFAWIEWKEAKEAGFLPLGRGGAISGDE